MQSNGKIGVKYLFEIDRITEKPNPIIDGLGKEIGLTIRDIKLNHLIDQSLDIVWTRDPFDRLIVAQARLEDAFLLTKDDLILQNFELARW